MSFQVTNYHSKKALSKAVLSGKKISLKSIPLTEKQLRENELCRSMHIEPTRFLQVPLPFQSYEITGSSKNKQVPFWVATVETDKDGFIAYVM